MEIITDISEVERVEIRPFGSIGDEEGPRCGIKCLAFVLSYEQARKLQEALNAWGK